MPEIFHTCCGQSLLINTPQIFTAHTVDLLLLARGPDRIFHFLDRVTVMPHCCSVVFETRLLAISMRLQNCRSKLPQLSGLQIEGAETNCSITCEYFVRINLNFCKYILEMFNYKKRQKKTKCCF